MIGWMLERGGYHREMLVIERELDALLPSHHLAPKDPKARIDLAIYLKDPQGHLRCALLIECKATITTEQQLHEALMQLKRYARPLAPLAMAVVSSTALLYQSPSLSIDQDRPLTATLPTRDQLEGACFR